MVRLRGRGAIVALGSRPCFVIVVTRGATATSPSVTATDLGNLGGVDSQATATNAGGQVVGYSDILGGSTPTMRSCGREKGGTVDLGTLGG